MAAILRSAAALCQRTASSAFVYSRIAVKRDLLQARFSASNHRMLSTVSKVAKPQRSVLYLPGSNLKAIAKARTLPADMIVMDLEDAVAPDAKVTARTQVLGSLAEGFKNHPVIVRANGLDTPWGVDDLKALASAKGLHAIAIPKVEYGSTLIKINEILTQSGAPADLEVWCMIETPIGIFNLQEICSTGTSDAAGKRLSALVMGTSDLTKDLRAKHTADRHPLLTSLQLTLLAARAYGLSCLDGVHLALDDAAQLQHHCRQAMEMGFDGKTLIHPKQISVANEAFQPGADEVAECQEIVAAYEAALARGAGVVVVRGRLIENLHLDNARRILQLHEAIVAREAALGPAA